MLFNGIPAHAREAVMETSPIRMARERRGWSQSRLIGELRRSARLHGISLMSDSSLRVALSRWENNRVSPSPEYEDLLGLALGVSLSETQPAREARSTRPTGRLSLAVVTAQAPVLEALRRSDRLGCASITNPQLTAYALTLRTLLRARTGPLEAQLGAAALLADAEALIGWQLLDLGQPTAALANYRRAEESALRSEDPHLIAHARAGQAIAYLDLDRPGEAHQLMASTRDQAIPKVTPLFQAWLHAAVAETAAATGSQQECKDALAAADEALPGSNDHYPELPYVTLDRAHLQRWAGHSLSMLGDRQAVDILDEVVDRMPADFVRARGAMHTDLALCHSALGNAADARRCGRIATDLVRDSGSRRQSRRLMALQAA